MIKCLVTKARYKCKCKECKMWNKMVKAGMELMAILMVNDIIRKELIKPKRGSGQ